MISCFMCATSCTKPISFYSGCQMLLGMFLWVFFFQYSASPEFHILLFPIGKHSFLNELLVHF